MAITAVLAKLSAIYSNLSKVDNKVYGVKNGEFFEVPAPPTSLTVGQVRRLITLRG